jgi:hypothetical protein
MLVLFCVVSTDAGLTGFFADIIGALDLLAEQGQWTRCIDKAKTHSAPILHKYVALYAAKLLKDGFIKEALSLYSTHGAPAMPQNFNIYNHIASEIFALPDISGSFGIWEQLRQMLYEIVSAIRLVQISSDLWCCRTRGWTSRPTQTWRPNPISGICC